MKKALHVVCTIIGWIFVAFFLAFAFVYYKFPIPLLCFTLCTFLTCPLIKKLSLKLWLKIPLIFILFIFAIFQIPRNYNKISKENIITHKDEQIETISEKNNFLSQSCSMSSELMWVAIEADINQLPHNDASFKNLEEIETAISEKDFKNNCVEIIYSDLDDEWIGKYVTKEILFTSTEQHEYQCASTESYIENLDGFQHVYTIYDIYDCRFDKSFPIYANDVIRIYGIITDIDTNYANGLEYPIIDMYYADYIRE